LYSLAVYNGTPPALYCLFHLSPISTQLLPLLPLYPSKETTSRRREKKRTKINPGLSRVCPGRPGPGSALRVGRVWPGQFPACFLLRPGPATDPGRPGPGSTHRAGPGFKTLARTSKQPTK